MYIDPIHAGPGALAHAFALAARASTPRRRGFKWLLRLAWGSRPQDVADLSTADSVQLMLWSECVGRPYVTALGGLLMMNYFGRNIAGARQTLHRLPKRGDCTTDDDQRAT
jgi:hypothetical protein